MNVMLGISAAGGIGIGKIFILPESQELVIPQNKISSEDVAEEWKRFEDAVEDVQEEIESHQKSLGSEDLQRVIFETYQLMLTDPVFTKELKAALEAELYNVEYILQKKTVEYAQKLRSSGNDYLAERSHDIEDVFGKVMNVLLDYHPFNINDVPDGSIIVAKEMKTSDTVILSKRKIAGLALTEGGVASHVAILAKSYGIPAVVGLGNITNLVQDGTTMIVDGTHGEVIDAPDEKTLADYEEKILQEQKYLATLHKFKDKVAETQDGTRFKIYANIGTVEEAELALEEGADGIGLFRTEFLFMNEIQAMNQEGGTFSSATSEELQFQAYKRVLEIMDGRPVTIRTLDAGGDKLIASKDIPSIAEKNPLMGLRAIRMSLFYPNVFRTQLRALYRAGLYGNLRILLPLITDVAQVETALGIAKGVQMSLKAEGIPFKPDIPIGIMVETAAAAICADCLAPHSAFFSLGTNDLTQYTIGIDRENPTVAPNYNEFHLAVLRLIKNTIKASANANIPVSVCGEMAGNRESAMILAGMGIRRFSMAPKQIPLIKETLSQFSIRELETISSQSLL